DVPNLKLKWAFAFPGGTQAYGNPTIVAGRVFAGSDNGTVYALDANSGCTIWSFKADGGVRAAPAVGAIGRRFAVYFGDLKANVFAVDANTGELIWKKQADDHKFARITGAPTLANGSLYVPIASVEEVPGAQPTYECCTFRGSVVAVDAATGNQIWKSYTITETPQQTGKNAQGTALYGPAGAAVWSAPTIDERRGVLYVGTGNSYTGPAGETHDAIIATELKTRKKVWGDQGAVAHAGVVCVLPGRGERELPEGARSGFRFRQRAHLAHAAGRQADPRDRPEVGDRLGTRSRQRRQGCVEDAGRQGRRARRNRMGIGG